MLPTRKAVQAAVDAYFSGQITVEEAFERAYGPHPRKAAAGQAPPQENRSQEQSAAAGRRGKK